MGKYLQACKMNGSLYGKKENPDKKAKSDKSQLVEENLLNGYSKLYKKQLVIMNKVFRRDLPR